MLSVENEEIEIFPPIFFGVVEHGKNRITQVIMG
jgi:hypothetical protein